MTLLLLLVLLSLVLFAVFLGGGLIAQGYLYQEPTDSFPLRSLAAALLVGSFLTVWVWIDRTKPRKYDTFFEFEAYEMKPFDEIEAIRWTSPDGTKWRVDGQGKPVEAVTKYKRGTGTNTGVFLEEKTGTPFEMNSINRKTLDSFMTIAIRLKPEPGAEPVRFNARLREDKTYPAAPNGRDPRPAVRFEEVNGSRYVMEGQFGTVFVPSSGTVFLALLLNLLHFLIWFAAFWPILRFTAGHAVGLTIIFGLVTIILLMPLLFKPNRAPKPPEPPRVAQVIGTIGTAS